MYQVTVRVPTGGHALYQGDQFVIDVLSSGALTVTDQSFSTPRIVAAYQADSWFSAEYGDIPVAEPVK